MDESIRRGRALPDRDAGPLGAGAGGAEPGRGFGQDPTRKLLKVFGVKVTDYEERTDALLQRHASASAPERDEILREATELTADLDHWLSEITRHVSERKERVLARLRDR